MRRPTSPGGQTSAGAGLPKGTVWLDDLSLRDLSTGEDLVVNGAFER